MPSGEMSPVKIFGTCANFFKCKDKIILKPKNDIRENI